MGLLSTFGAASGRAFGLTRLGAAIKDAYFNLTTLLLSGNGTNGAQNNTFLDSSSNNFTITRNGNTTQGTFSPFSLPDGYWSIYLDGTGDYLNTPTSSQFAPTGDFTVGAWFYPTSLSTSNCIVGNYTSGVSTDWMVNVGSNGTVRFYNNSNAASITSSSGAVVKDTWNYVALVRSGTTVTLYVNGVSEGTVTYSGTLGSATKTIGIGANGSGSANCTGYISNVLLVDGTAYASKPSAPSTAVSGTKLLACQSNRFIDNSSSPNTLTRNGDTSVQAFSPFAPTAAYSAATNGGSGYFDGTGDYLLAPSTNNLAFGTGDFCVEMFVYANTSGAVRRLYSNSVSAGGGDAQFEIQLNPSNQFAVAGWATVFLTGTSAIPANAWAHVAVCRSGTTMSLFVNGVREATTTTANNFSSVNAFNIGRGADGSGALVGYIAGLRAVKGSSVYNPSSTTITIPAAPPTAITNTQLLLNFTNAGIIDATGDNVLETVGNAQISTTQSKFGGGSIAFDGTGDWLLMPNSPLHNFQSSDFTIEFWMYLNSSANQNVIAKWWTGGNQWVVQFRAAGADSRASAHIRFAWNSSSTADFDFTMPTGTWMHIAVVRSGTTLSCYKDGVKNAATGTIGAITATTDVLSIGQFANVSSDAFSGYLDNVRITNYARYTANFTPPTAAFPLS